jgi:hypothetical protein
MHKLIGFSGILESSPWLAPHSRLPRYVNFRAFVLGRFRRILNFFFPPRGGFSFPLPFLRRRFGGWGAVK